ncbi:LIM domain protein [Aspergillus nomiae NRRL 13137]|uniref:LIM domain protein n=1 Tax=Aspergillus nomiae NRRL (strain ATCC 15546 / NRRL 13137 / CBS 260.88 / M93) TaxID=1509407 RepID=A0A0L1J4I6_ASPN3|nr:LIM domain protein [Aspergillus nomiae NRRL 13137]KNG86647.1 LIM domain protein [Aspergillus nomiae NRRL 13137]
MYRPYLHHNKTKDGQRKVSPPGPSYMSDNQVANYLKDLRTNRPTRPGGSRPLPTTPAESNPREDLPPRAASAMSSYSHSRMPSTTTAGDRELPRATSSLSNHRPVSSRGSIGSPAGRPLVQEPRMVPVRKNVSPTRVFSRPSPPSPNTAYRESYRRRFEREEAQSLRNALQEMDIQDDIRLHQAAQDEATELVWMHQNPGLPFKNPYAPYRNPDMERSSQGSDRSSVLIGHTPASRSPQGDSYRPRSDYYTDSPSKRAEEQQPASDEPNSSPRKNGTLRKNLKVDFSLPQNGSPSKRTSSGYGLGLGSISNGPSKGVFRNPNDHIYEEPGESQHMDDERPDFSRSDSSALKVKPRNAVPRGSRPLSGRFGSLSFVDKLSRFELHKHPPTQSRNPEYKANDPLPQANPNDEQAIPKKDGIEIRSDEIRAATSKKLKDRSTRLPMPTAPTEAQSPGKGIDVGTRESASPTPPPAPAAPTIEISEAPSIPVINLPDDKPPTLSEMAGSSQDRKKDESSLPTSPSSSKRSNPFQRKSPSSALQNRWLSTYSRAGVPTATCESCALPISGKIVTAAGSRFHPECFMCHHCQTPLECVAFYQEPDAKRQERLAAVSEADEEARLLRFYCHLDFHEMFSPRCKSCKTPIEGEVVVACGAEWHVGHFFCAECGDKRMVLHGVFNAIPGALLLDARGAKNQYLMMLSSQLSEVSGMMSALSVTNVVPGLGRTADILSEKANRKEQQKAASSEAQSSYLYAKDARAYDLRHHLGFDNDCTRNAEKTRFII